MVLSKARVVVCTSAPHLDDVDAVEPVGVDLLNVVVYMGSVGHGVSVGPGELGMIVYLHIV